MKRLSPVCLAALALLASTAIAPPRAVSAATNVCKLCPVGGVDSHATTSLGSADSKNACQTGHGTSGFPIPDPACTPGAFNPTTPPNIFGTKGYTTKCVRNCVTDGQVKKTTYKLYHVKQNTTCELDHLVPLEMGGADSLDNIWPQCGTAPNGKKYKDMKDRVEQYLAIQVVQGMSWDEARKGIAADWTQYIAAAEKFCATKSCEVDDYRK